jgi:hypothetical protein
MLKERRKLARFCVPLVALSLFCPVVGFYTALLRQPQHIGDFTDLFRVVDVGIFSTVGVILALIGGLVGGLSKPGGAFKIGVFVNLG